MSKKIVCLLMVVAVGFAGAVDARSQRCKEHKPATTPSSDFVVHKNGTVTHKKTGLIWKRCVEGMIAKGDDCVGEVKKYFWDDMDAKLKRASFAGRRDWRPPTIDELKSIVEKRCKGPAANIEVFPNTPNALPMWSGSIVAGRDDKAWQMYIASGVAIKANKGIGSAVRLVRSR